MSPTPPYLSDHAVVIRDQPDSSPDAMLTVCTVGSEMMPLLTYIALRCSLSHQKGA